MTRKRSATVLLAAWIRREKEVAPSFGFGQDHVLIAQSEDCIKRLTKKPTKRKAKR